MQHRKEKYQIVEESRKEIFFNNVIGGIGWALGATIVASFILALASFILSHFNTVPYIGNYLVEINRYLSHKN